MVKSLTGRGGGRAVVSPGTISDPFCVSRVANQQLIGSFNGRGFGAKVR